MAEKVRIDPDVLLKRRREFVEWFDDWIVEPEVIHDDDAAAVERRLQQRLDFGLQMHSWGLAAAALGVSIAAIVLALSGSAPVPALQQWLVGGLGIAIAVSAVVILTVRQRGLTRLVRRVNRVQRVRLILAQQSIPPRAPSWRRRRSVPGGGRSASPER